MERVSILLIGILLVAGGIYIFFHRTFYDWKYGFMNMGSFHSVIGIIFVMVGLYFIYGTAKAIRRHRRKGPPSDKDAQVG